MHRRENLLFSEGDLHDTLDNHTRQISEKVNAIPKDQFLSTPEQDLIDHIFAEIHIEPLRRCIPFYETRPLTRMPSESNRVSLTINPAGSVTVADRRRADRRKWADIHGPCVLIDAAVG